MRPMRPIKVSTLKMVLLAGAGELALATAFGGSVTTGLMSLGMHWAAAVPAAVVAWNAGERLGLHAARSASVAVGYGLGKAAALFGTAVDTGMRGVRMMLAGDGNLPGARPDSRSVGLAHEGNLGPLAEAAQRAVSGPRPVMVDTLLSPEGYEAFMKSAQKARIPVIDLDSYEERKAARLQKPYDSIAHAVGDLTSRTEKNPLKVEDAERILQRTASSRIAGDHKKALYELLYAELLESREALARDREERTVNVAKATQAVEEIDRIVIEKLRGNAELREVVETLGVIEEPDRFFQALQRSVAQDGVDSTLKRIETDPDGFDGVGRSQGTTESRIGKEPELLEALKDTW